MKILIVDDSRDFQVLVERILTSKGYDKPYLANDAKEAFDLLEVEREDGNPAPVDLVLMDLLMPEISGVEALQRRAPHTLFPPQQRRGRCHTQTLHPALCYCFVGEGRTQLLIL